MQHTFVNILSRYFCGKATPSFLNEIIQLKFYMQIYLCMLFDVPPQPGLPAELFRAGSTGWGARWYYGTIKLPTSRPPSLHTLVVTLTVENKFEVFDLQSFISILRCQSQFPGTAVSPLAATDCNLNFEIECQSKTFKFRTWLERRWIHYVGSGNVFSAGGRVCRLC